MENFCYRTVPRYIGLRLDFQNYSRSLTNVFNLWLVHNPLYIVNIDSTSLPWISFYSMMTSMLVNSSLTNSQRKRNTNFFFNSREKFSLRHNQTIPRRTKRQTTVWGRHILIFGDAGVGRDLYGDHATSLSAWDACARSSRCVYQSRYVV